MARDYSAAITALNTLQSNFSIVEAIRKAGKSMNEQAIPEMAEWCNRLGYEPSDLNRLHLIHIAGTKGKGSTSAFISSILQQYAGSSPAKPGAPRKVGLFTSPHLRSVRERIRIDDEPISEEMFAKYFYEVWDRLEQASKEKGPGPGTMGPIDKPVYFRYLTLMMFHAYLSEGVDTAIVECGIGGEYDSTNIIEKPIVSAVTRLGIDHVGMLGGTVEEIAWHKAGVFKEGAKCREVFAVEQPGDAMSVLRSRAEKKGLRLVEIGRHPQIEDGTLPLALNADFQKSNASLAVAVCAAHLRTLGVSGIPEPATKGDLPAEFVRGLAQVRWGGRCEARREGKITWYIDGGHTLESIQLAAEWYASTAKLGSPAKRQRRVLFFNQQTRDAPSLARHVHETLSGTLGAEGGGRSIFSEAIFSTNITFAPKESEAGSYKADLVSMNASSQDVSALTVQRGLAEVWSALDADCEVSVETTIESAVSHVRRLAASGPADEELSVFVTGSLHLVGGVLEVLETTTPTTTTTPPPA